MRNLFTKITTFLLLYALCLPLNLFGQALTKTQQQALDKLVLQSPIFARHFYGFVLYDPNGKLTLFQKDADKFFTPASNTKIFTLYTALKVLKDSLPVLRYTQEGAFTVFQGMGNPMFLNPLFPQDSVAWSFLNQEKGYLAFSASNFKDERFGNGWAWNDFRDDYQAEKGSFPIYGNLARFQLDSSSKKWRTMPEYFLSTLEYDPTNSSLRPEILREEHDGHFLYNAACLRAAKVNITTPFKYRPHLVCELLSDTLKRKVQVWNPPVLSNTWRTLSTPLPDTLLQLFMQESDNYIAEQLLLSTSARLFGDLDISRTIEYAQRSILGSNPDGMVWVDGSGLSRYNLFSPRTIVSTLEKLYQEYPSDRLFRIFPAGGVSGTIKEWYAGKEGKPYVFAKTGTLSNNHCLSGYVRTNKGRVLIFSFMHNHYLGSATPIRREMQKILEWVRDNL
ncbi:MAG TPA: D-alanyl-D-alanine carboxypeptidase [Haliscomenobacter sp.]|uniref:D-alanyl-D-alanine carboxypeptidase/D-alanyl-D-alanine-endopeptidase n=1 Tax=Haliscomenobacter sp. TaxID=2717303 RepID=UPI002C36673C|nr:D-alanyl-D-alanine carboxypeptidase [Haliscomenobacter sp.]HOY17131.1 D-alanyl-D-alanine carboxypeptidase [Haliscomenobacter sp.]HPH19254.1 D-alanyl-D-alanine carboxypeptidase [Haliscomenobacter sp.]